MIEALPPPVFVAAAPIPSRNVMVWGDQGAMEAMQTVFEAKGWRWATVLLGGQSNALLLIPPTAVADAEITSLINDVNSGQFGKLNAGYAEFGWPQNEQSSN